MLGHCHYGVPAPRTTVCQGRPPSPYSTYRGECAMARLTTSVSSLIYGTTTHLYSRIGHHEGARQN